MACLIVVGTGGGLIFGPQLVSVKRAQIPLPPWMGCQFSPCTAVGVISDEARLLLIAAGRSPLPDILAGLVVVPSSMVYCGPDLPVEPTYTPAKRAPYRSGWPGPSATAWMPANSQTESQ